MSYKPGFDSSLAQSMQGHPGPPRNESRGVLQCSAVAVEEWWV